MTSQLTPWLEAYKKKIISPFELEKKISQLKSENNTIVTLNGSFDLMHAGHLHMIHEASQLGNVLIVGLNTDRSIQAYKSPSRPLVTLDHRMQMMAALGFVDYVTWFDELNPIALLEIIKPHVHVNGSEYGANCIEAPTVLKHGGQIHIVDLLPGLSTSSLLKKIQSEG